MRGQLARTVRAGGQRKRTTSNRGTALLADPTAPAPRGAGRQARPAAYGAGAVSHRQPPVHRPTVGSQLSASSSGKSL